MPAPPRSPQLILLLPTLALLLVHSGTAAPAVEIVSPTSQAIAIGDNATFRCIVTEIRDYSFRWVMYSNDSGDKGLNIESSITPPDGISITNNTSQPMHDMVSTITFEGRKEFDNIELYCTLWVFQNTIKSNPATLIVIGPPNNPSTLTFLDKHVDIQSQQFLAIWSVPFSHENHPISSYSVSVVNTNSTESYRRSITVSSEAKSSPTENATLDFPPLTNSCDILNITLTAFNDIGPSEPASANLFIPTDPDTDVSVNTNVSFHQSSISVLLEIQFPTLCWFERLNYSVLLRHEGMKSVVVEESVLNPPGYVMHNISAIMEADTNYSIIVQAWTAVWDTVTTPHNFSTHFKPPDISVSTVAASTNIIEPTFDAISPQSSSSSHKILAAGLGAGGVLVVLILIALLLLLVIRSQTKRADHPISIEDMKIGSVPYDLQPNPIYDGPLYDTIQDPVTSFKPAQLLTTLSPATGESMYSESPTLSRKRQEAMLIADHQKDLEDNYVQMHACKRP